MKGFFAVVGTLILFLNCHFTNAEEPPPPQEKNFTVNSIKLEGEIADEDNITFTLAFSAEAAEPGSHVMVSGKITELASEVKVKASGFLWLGGGKFKIVFKDGAYVLECVKAGKCDVKFTFAAKVEDMPTIMPLAKNQKAQIMPPPEDKKGIKTCTFGLLPAVARSIQIKSAKKDIDLSIMGGLNIEKKDVPGTEGAIFTAVLPPEGLLQMTWRSQVEKITANLVTSVQATTIAEVFPGTVKLNSMLQYTVIQGRLSNLEIKISQGLNILSVTGENIQDWKVNEDKEKGDTLVVTLSKYYEDSYSVSVESEKVLPDFPSKFSLPTAVPLKALRIDGYLAFGTDGAIKLIVDKTTGLNQIDNSSFPAENRRKIRALPKKTLFTYKFSGEKYSLDTSADNIMPNYTVDLTYVLNFKDEDLIVRANCSLDIKDAPLRELLIKYSNDMTVNRVEGRATMADDYETFEKEGQKWLKIPFAPDTLGKADLFINFEKSMKNTSSTKLPSFFIDGAKTVRGNVLLASNRGLSLAVDDIKGLRKYPTGSAPIREPGLQHNYRFKDQEWEGKVTITHEQVNIVSEVFHIGSVGEGTIYGSSIFTYHVSGAPIDKIQLKINPSVKNLEFTGGNIVDWKMTESNAESQTWQVNFKEKIFGDYTLLSTYESPLSGAETKYRMGDLVTVGAGAESGFIALTSARNLKVSSGKSSESVTEIEASEIPDEYKAFLQNPILKAYRFTLTPHWIDMGISGYASQQMINIAVDHARFTSRIDRNGQAVTTAEYRIKNSSLQFLAMELPAKSELWTVKVNGEKKRISSSNSKYLIPLPRNKNTDDPIAVEITYAEKNGELGKSADIKLTAPTLDLETMFSRWLVQVPENYNLYDYGGNMAPLRNPQRIGLGGILSRLSMWIKRFLNPLVLIPWIAFTAVGALVVWSWTSGRMKIPLTIISVIAIGIVLVVMFNSLQKKFHRTLPEFMPEPVNACEFTRLFSLPQDTPKIEICMSDMKGTSFLKLLYAGAMTILGFALLGIGMLSKGGFKSSMLISVGIVFLLSALSHWLYVNAIIAFLLAALVPVILTFGFWRMIFMKYRNIAVACLAFCFIIPFSTQAADSSGITIEDVLFKISAAITDDEKSITGTARYIIKAEKGGTVIFLPAPAVLTGGTDKISGLEIIRSGNNYMLKAESSGEYEFEISFLLPVVEEKSGNFQFPITIPLCKRNSVEVRMNRENIDITSQAAVFFKSIVTNNICSAQANFVPGTNAIFKFRPQVRKVEKEKTVFFTSIDALAKFASGFVEIKSYLNFQVAQGETAKFAVEIPENMRVTSVSAPDLGAWRFVEESHLLEVFLSQPHHGNFTATIVTQIANCNLPYESKIGTLSVKDAGKQHGTLGVSVDSNVQVLVDDKLDGFNSINLNDFTAKFADIGPALKKAFRYNKPPASITVKASAVEPELRVKENYTVSFEEEKTVLTSDLNLEIAKSGIFSVSIDIPENYDIDKVTGSDVQHWDEISEKNVHKILVHFDKSICGTTDIHLELTLSERKREKSMTIPKITVSGTQKHKGDLTITLERGTRMDIASRQGLEIKTEGFAQSRDKNAHRFSIVRADWELKVSFDVIAPWVQAEILQIGKVTEGVVEYDAYFHYSIENAGVKSFRIRLPENAETPEFSGENMADPRNVENDKSLWEIELHQKVNGKYMLQAHYRIPFGKNTQVKIAPVVTEGTELQKGYLAVLSDDSLQVKLSDKKGEISEFDVRKIPTYFKVSYLSNAVMCFRTVGNDYSITLEAIRHKTADQLKAQIKSVNISSVVSPEGRVITSTQLSLINGNQTFLEMKLPEGSNLWSVLIDNQAVDVAKEKSNLLIPLRQGLSGGGRDQNIEIIYSLQADKAWSTRNQIYNGPSFNLPLRNVSWNLYLPKEFQYSNFGGTLDYFDRTLTSLTYINLEDYDKDNEMYNDEKNRTAKVMLSKANKSAASGKKQEASEFFQSASNLSLNDAELNADVKGQWQQVQRDNSIQGLVGRRVAQKKGKSVSMDELQVAPNAPIKPLAQIEDINAIKQQLGGTEVSHLQTISDKIFMQQQQAAAVPHPLRLTIPEGGTKLEFRRALQVTPFAPTQISFKAKKTLSWDDFSEVFAGIAIMFGIAILFLLVKPMFRKTETAD
ncbi:MAG TPA: hypothetical protein DCZ94_10055 [Lentisphaeria bacterium]|nr:MAG: hypothetical protein A2X48_08465 [Lentisphaerae bacterium GWF2_49_21]HBC87287.1 hypothetical protein [Lentisphaeria bacterium]